MKTKYTIFLAAIMFYSSIFSQVNELNLRDKKGRKTGYWVDYLDENFNRAKIPSKNRYKIIQCYEKDKVVCRYANRNSKNPDYIKDTRIEFIKGAFYNEKDSLLDGKVIYYYFDKIFQVDSFSKGMPIFYVFNAYAPPDRRSILLFTDKVYFLDSYNNTKAYSYRFFENDKNNVLHLTRVIYWIQEDGKWKRKKVKNSA